MNYNEELKVSKKLKDKFSSMESKIEKKFDKDFYDYIFRKDMTYQNRNYKELPDSFGKSLRLYLDEGGLPSEFFKKNIDRLKGYIPENYLPYFYKSLDTVNEWQVAWNYYNRRSYRGKNDYSLYLERFLDIISAYRYLADFAEEGYDIYALIKGEISEEMKIYFRHERFSFKPEYYIAAKLDEGDEKLEEALTEVIYGETGTIEVNYLRGIFMSHNEKMFELVGKTLLAARLSEGLRQVICENMDFGTKEGFLYMLKVIEDNKLIRFSSVKRAIATFTGLFAYDSKDIDRISEKNLVLIGKALSDDSVIEEMLKSEDSMDIYLGLWAIGFDDARTAFERATQLSMEGSRHQRLVACYFIANSNVPYSKNDYSKRIFKKYLDDDETLAIIMKIFMELVGTTIYNTIYPKGYRYNEEQNLVRVYTDLKIYFDTQEECREFNDLLYSVLERLPKKGHKFEASVFPWNTVNLSPSDIVIRIVFCASALKDKELMAKAAGMLKDISSESGDRLRAVELILREPDTPELMDILTQEISDADTSVRSVAFKLLKNEMEEDRSSLPGDIASPAGKLPERSYMILEEMLRLKRADLRSNVLSLLSTRGPEEKLEMLQRLFEDGKEERVTAGLDIILQLKKNEDVSFKAAADTIKYIKKPTTKEKILIDEIIEKPSETAAKQELFYDINATYEPVIEEEYLSEALETFYTLFPDSKAADVINPPKDFSSKLKKLVGAGKKSKNNGKTEKDFIKALDDLIEANKDREYNVWNGPVLLGNSLRNEYVNGKNTDNLPFLELWDEFLENHEITNGQLLVLYLNSINMTCTQTIYGYTDFFKPLLGNLFSPILADKKFPDVRYKFQIHSVLEYYLIKRDFMKNDKKYINAITALYLNRTKEVTEFTFKGDQYINEWTRKRADASKKYKKSIIENHVIAYALGDLRDEDKNYPIKYEFVNGIVQDHLNNKSFLEFQNYGMYRESKWQAPHAVDEISAFISGYISKDFMYKNLMAKENIRETLQTLSSLIKYIYESDVKVSTRRRYSWYRTNVTFVVGDLLRQNMKDVKREDLTEVQEKKLKLAEECYEKISKVVLDTELVRGDTETEYSSASLSLDRVYGVNCLVRILGALGEETLDRTSYFFSYRNRDISKRESLSHLLSVCIPDPREGDSAEQAKALKELVKCTDIKEQRLIEAGLYSPEWLPIISEYLGWDGFMSGCYYFMAHMNEKFDDKRAAIIAKYTPLTEEELNAGAFDINWFNEVYKTLGKKRFDEIYKAAKYISDGGKHTRARKYADAARGDMDPVKTAEEIEKKRNKDLLMAYALIPCKDKEKKDRYSFIQKYIKESKQFGAQRRASEKAAGEMAIKNMATASGFSDETRFILKMEREISSGLSKYFEPHDIDEYTVWLEPDDGGKMNLLVKKGDKTLKSVPAGLKKNDYIVDISDAKKSFTEQYRRTRIMMEEAMESETEFFVSEILDMSSDRVIGPMINRLLFKQGDFFGFPEDIKTEGLKASSSVVVAHPYHMYESGRWHEFQKLCFDRQIRQPFKQIFRELYVKTEEEMNSVESMRYAGNQINPKMTVGVLRSRRWIADAEEGLQKVYYKENIIATIYALADWFAPSDIEAPTLEWVAFYDRKTFMRKPVSEIPDIIFSEVMRDVDLAVSVAHAGGIDPEMSHSTIEMRRAIAEFLVPMFKLKNVTFTDSHAKIKGERGSYTVHLGSGVIHQEGGPMINVLPVHSQHRGRIFLPFVDDDPKTSEIMSKIIFFAEDKKIKDPFILQQIV